ncbi:uncharacterized protein BP01DRAFT_175734 [Aspergillus saccharolyticus JOP 1030-1]|uniref:Secreted protein n=1 Tax=Aspergillus saccharolyticus JOP 1030-1 TaxID=1450539 RepID=A0A318ZM85_9EURO|nr:hypothetical protein BP01DRAFT_175734 [Aspergillus saccharolyticus JOP 1030-1]PYH48067.1 hypothetical protein BP01DRAFT_175734 [Aspergillus saccharolyticus JOP 1030-1]
MFKTTWWVFSVAGLCRGGPVQWPSMFSCMIRPGMSGAVGWMSGGPKAPASASRVMRSGSLLASDCSSSMLSLLLFMVLEWSMR